MDGLPVVMWALRRSIRTNRQAGLSVPQFRTLAYIDRFPCAPLSLVAENLGATLPTTSRIISGLVRAGLVTRKDASGDRRKLSLELTPKGMRALESVRKSTQAYAASLLQDLEPKDRAAIAVAIRTLKRVFAAGPSNCKQIASPNLKRRKSRAR